MAKLIKTIHIKKVVVYEADLSKEDIDLYVDDEDRFLENVEKFNFKEIDSKEKSSEWIRVYTNETPY